MPTNQPTPKEERKIREKTCYKDSDLTDLDSGAEPLKDNVFSDGAKWFCESTNGRPDKMDPKSPLFGKYKLLTEPESTAPGDIRDFPTYYYGVRWLPDCVLADDPQSQGFRSPWEIQLPRIASLFLPTSTTHVSLFCFQSRYLETILNTEYRQGHDERP